MVSYPEASCTGPIPQAAAPADQSACSVEVPPLVAVEEAYSRELGVEEASRNEQAAGLDQFRLERLREVDHWALR